MSTRSLRAKPQVPIVPCIITDEDASSWPSVGLTARRLREVVRDLHVPHVRHGRRILVRVADLEAVLVKNATIAGSANDTDDEHELEHELEHEHEHDDEAHDAAEHEPILSVDAILALAGKRARR